MHNVVVITVASGTPYPTTGLTTAWWMLLPAMKVCWDDLVTTQEYVHIAALLQMVPQVSRDPLPHIVRFGGRLYLEDGHTRVTRDLLYGIHEGWARVFTP